MPTTPIYDKLLSEVTDELEKRILDILLNINENTAGGITRQQLVLALYGYWPDNLSNDPCDRIVRKAIEHLRENWPITSSSGGGGYRLSEDEDEIKAFAAEQESRAEKNRHNAKLAYGWLPKARAIREIRRTSVRIIQPSLL
jgi:hypothetical protein